MPHATGPQTRVFIAVVVALQHRFLGGSVFKTSRQVKPLHPIAMLLYGISQYEAHGVLPALSDDAHEPVGARTRNTSRSEARAFLNKHKPHRKHEYEHGGSSSSSTSGGRLSSLSPLAYFSTLTRQLQPRGAAEM